MDTETTEPRGDLTKVTVNLTNDAMGAVESTAIRLGHTRTDTINRAVQLYAYVVDMRPGERIAFNRIGDERVTLRRVDGLQRRLTLLGVLMLVLAFAAGVVTPW